MGLDSLNKILFVGFLVVAMVFGAGCFDDSSCPEPESGTVHVECEPDTLTVPWTITLPGGLFAAGEADTSLHTMSPGEYVITWGAVDGWVRDDTNATTLVLENESAIYFRSVFVEDDSPSGRISVEPSPACVDAPWVLSGPNGFVTDGSHGTVVFEGMEEGDYTLAWGGVPGWETPDPDIVEQFLPGGGSLTFTGLYVEKASGMIAVDPNPDSIGAIWHLDGPDGFAFDGSGDMTLGNMMVGDYTMVWTAAENWITPASETLTVVADNTVTFTGDYEVDLPLAITPDAVVENFQTVYEIMFFEGYESLLSADHRTEVLPSTFDEWEGSEDPLTFPYFDLSLITTIHDNMFNGRAGVDPVGLIIPPIDSIAIPMLEKQGPWDPVEGSMEYYGQFNGYMTTYRVLINFNKPDGSRFQVEQVLKIITVEESGIWKLLGIIPIGYNGVVSTDSVSYDEVLSLYR